MDLLSPQDLIVSVQTPEPENSRKTNALGIALSCRGGGTPVTAFPTPLCVWLFAKANWNGDWRITEHRETSASRSSSYHRDLSTHGGLEPHLQDSLCLSDNRTDDMSYQPLSARCLGDFFASSHLLEIRNTGFVARFALAPAIPISVNSMSKESFIEELVCPHWVQTQSRCSTSGEAHVGGLAANLDHAARYLTTPMHRKAHTIWRKSINKHSSVSIRICVLFR
ncbi:hypothetical protein BS47DRAFT_889613 [Hydnum rufescens UP504]|uniref:Uncharacterized protein n=1 Tax=Hydnum rufescens UP504 TaxID=1448309 RepID=A0A9P6AZH0_9AGAM|nr:hypothetical protein BS47DRAFT_889613 [Hydnum rufescens UP504]